jgi:8-oxo-dGTP pyrophosphatase MutT (NUDIX family)
VTDQPDGYVRVTSSRTVYENRWMVVREDRTILPDGSPGLYAVVVKPPAATIVAYDDGRVWLVEQYRHPVGERFWEVPQGAWEDAPDAAPEELARGELAEETGLRAAHMRRLGRQFFAYGISNQPYDVWLATGLTEGEQALEDTEQGLRVGRFAHDDVVAMVRDGRIADAASIASLGLAGLL